MPDLKPGKKPYAAPKKCKFCLEAPCILDHNAGDDLDGSMDLYQYLMKVGDDAVASGMTMKEARYDLYRIAIRFYHGFLGKGIRKELLLCICRRDKGFLSRQRR
jgi:hypothetical protein